MVPNIVSASCSSFAHAIYDQNSDENMSKNEQLLRRTSSGELRKNFTSLHLCNQKSPHPDIMKVFKLGLNTRINLWNSLLTVNKEFPGSFYNLFATLGSLLPINLFFDSFASVKFFSGNFTDIFSLPPKEAEFFPDGKVFAWFTWNQFRRERERKKFIKSHETD